MFFVIFFMHYTIQEKRRFEKYIKKRSFVITLSYGKVHFLRNYFSIVSVGQYRLNLPDLVKYIQALLGHRDPRSTEIYLHVSNKTLLGIRSPFDEMGGE